MKKKIAIRCLTKTSKGYGHFSRCLSVATSLEKNNVKVHFIIDYNKYIISRLKHYSISYIVIPNNISIQQESKFIIHYLNSHALDTLVIDMREYGERLSKSFHKNNFKTILFDDAWCKNVFADLLFNGTNVSKYHNYNILNPNSKQFLGPKFWISNEKFLHYRKKSTSIKPKKYYKIIISLGGADKNNLTLHVLNSISALRNIRVFVIVGPFFNKQKIKMQFSGKNPNHIKFINRPNKIWKLFSSADIAISSGGNTLFELACLGIPTLCIPSTKHEILYAKSFALSAFSFNLGLKQTNPTIISKSLLKLLDDPLQQKTMCISGKKIIDGKGLSRVIKIILKFLS